MVTSGSLRDVMVAHWPGMPEMWVQFPLYANISHFYHTHDTGFHNQDPVQAMCCMVVVRMCMRMYDHGLNVIVNIKRLTIPGRPV